ncbi:hypothetical protein AB0J90_24080 [Micromonospora sp. NPDC049523]|uniref:hypothetical protein n=1 Tax=Micromonospora sp. NPDC049523 TaxID=3155921 RepID=UPI00342B1BA6
MLSVRMRWRIALPLIGLSLLLVAPALFGTWAWWSDHGVAFRALSIVICLVVIVNVGVAISIGVRPARDVPWLRIGLVALGILLTCGLAVLRREVQ